MSKKRFKRGFTITELVIVIAVIAVLAAILIPTFSSLIMSSKESADKQTLKQFNTALYNYELLHGKTRFDTNATNSQEVYVQVMDALTDYGFTDKSNKYLVSAEIQQENKYLFWQNSTNTVMLLDDIVEGQFDTSKGPNFYVADPNNWDASTGLVLSTYNCGDFGTFAMYYSGAIGSSGMTDSIWSSVVKSYEVKLAAGLSSATAKTDWYDDTVMSSKEAKLTDKIEQQLQSEIQSSNMTAQEQEQRRSVLTATYLAGVVNLVKNGINFSGVNIELASSTPVTLATEEETSYSTWTPIADTHRDKVETTPVFQGSLDMTNRDGSPTVVKGLAVSGQYLSSSAEYQTQSDNGFSGGAYNISYGFFSSISGLNGPVTVKGINFQDVSLDFTGVLTSANGTEYEVVSDSVGILCGYAVGDVTFENITIGTAEKPAYIAGYDGVGTLCGRYYGINKGADKETAKDRVLNIKNCEVYANVYGQRRAGGFIGYIGGTGNKTMTVNVTDSKYQGFIYDTGEFSDVAETGALFGGLGSNSINVNLSNYEVASAFALAYQSNTAKRDIATANFDDQLMWTNRVIVDDSANSSGTILFTSYKSNQNAKVETATSYNITYDNLKVYKVAMPIKTADILASPLTTVKKQVVTIDETVEAPSLTGSVNGYNWKNSYTIPTA